jgi:adenylate cyclase
MAPPSLVPWLLAEGSSFSDLGALFEALGRRLNALGVPILRLNLTAQTLHPLLVAENVIWKRQGDVTQRNRFAGPPRDRSEYRMSPVRPLLEGEATEIRVAVVLGTVHPFPILDDYATQGATDYLALALNPGAPLLAVLSVMSDRPGGFSSEDEALVRESTLALRVLVELHIHRMVAHNIASTYIGPQTGPRVLAGEIRRGSVETLQAAIWFCDLRDFTPTTARLGSQAVVNLLNHFFGTVGPPIEARGGEILKFIGDAALAIFPIREGDSAADASSRALLAAEAALLAIAASNELRIAAGETPLRCGIALNVGEVSYGNIGAEARLDFTVIGAAVNLAARLEGLAGHLGETLLASDDFARACPIPLRAVGRHRLKGIDEPQEVWAFTPRAPADAD